MKIRIAVFMVIGFGLPLAALAHGTPVTPVRDVENPARSPFVVEGSVEITSGDLSNIGQVPAGKRAVIEFISMACQVVPPDTIVGVAFFFPEANGFRRYELPISKQGEPGESIFQRWVTAQLVRIYADEGQISISVNRSNTRSGEPPGGCFVNISGHTIKVGR